MRSDNVLKLAISRQGKLYEPALDLLRSCGIPVEWEGERRFSAQMPTLPGIEVIAGRADDICMAIQEGSIGLGIVGLDRYRELCQEGGESLTLLEDLGFAQCELRFAVPDSWTGVNRAGDLAAKSRQQGEPLRIATKYPHLTQGFLQRHEVSHYTLVEADGTLEAFQALGRSEIIADIVETGVTLRANGFKTLEDGLILTSQACLIGSLRNLRASHERQTTTEAVLDRIEAFLRAEDSFKVTANMPGESAEAVARGILQRGESAGLVGPTVAPVYSLDSAPWYSVTLVVDKAHLLEAVNHLRSMGGDGFLVENLPFVFQGQCQSYQTLLKALKRGEGA